MKSASRTGGESDRSMIIGALAAKTGTRIETIRYYERTGVLPQPPRTRGGFRRYGEADVARVLFVRHARDLGFPLDSVRELLSQAALAPSTKSSCAEVDRLAHRQLALVEQRLRELTLLRQELRGIVRACRGPGPLSKCRILAGLQRRSARRGARGR